MSENITSVSYGKTFNLGGYENEKIFITTAVTEGETPEQAVERTRMFVERQHKASQEVYELERRAVEAENRAADAIQRLTAIYLRQIDAAEAYTRIRAQLLALGIDNVHVPELSRWDAPMKREDFDQLVTRLRGDRLPTTIEADDEDSEYYGEEGE